jgi:hypothetical protein
MFWGALQGLSKAPKAKEGPGVAAAATSVDAQATEFQAFQGASWGLCFCFGCEKQCNPDPKRASEYKFTDTEFPYLNSGMFIGRVWALRKCILEYKYNDHDDDQRFWTTQFFEKPELIGLDYKNKLFLNTVDMDERFFHLDKTENIAIYRGADPLFVHVNGPDKKSIKQYL